GIFVEVQTLQAIGIDYIGECELHDAADDDYVNLHNLQVPFACGCRNLGEALMRVMEGAVIWSLPRSGNMVKTVRSVMRMIRNVTNNNGDEFVSVSEMSMPYNIVPQVKQNEVHFIQNVGGGFVTPADAAL
ncbi:LOW QUALITY PROTEIN: SOR_SNZ domain-containing protein, partial [Cephalotus follicularis]